MNTDLLKKLSDAVVDAEAKGKELADISTRESNARNEYEKALTTVRNIRTALDSELNQIVGTDSRVRVG